MYTRQARLLLHILDCLKYETAAEEPFFALKGGTALNFFIQPFPRLSVDIDLTYCPLDERSVALAAMSNGLC
jgi:predicted nucleotidyltransferase component of viral defense system